MRLCVCGGWRIDIRKLFTIVTNTSVIYYIVDAKQGRRKQIVSGKWYSHEKARTKLRCARMISNGDFARAIFWGIRGVCRNPCRLQTLVPQAKAITRLPPATGSQEGDRDWGMIRNHSASVCMQTSQTHSVFLGGGEKWYGHGRSRSSCSGSDAPAKWHWCLALSKAGQRFQTEIGW